MKTRSNIAKRIEQLEQAQQERKPREQLQPPVWISTGEPERRYKWSELKPGELPPPIWLMDDD
jgi:hypothetical protein